MSGLTSSRFQLPTPTSPNQPICLPPVQEPIPQLPISPPDSAQNTPNIDKRGQPELRLALHVLSTERAGLEYLEKFYHGNRYAQEALLQSISVIASATKHGGKLVITGVGKSGKIGQKIEATFKSFGIDTTFLYPTDALHGDLGTIKSNDIILMVSYSGTTGELVALLPHIHPSIPVIAMTSHTELSSCPLLVGRPNRILLPSPIHESEKTSFTVSAPTTSTTVALALGDALALAVAQRLHLSPAKTAEVFLSNHPGGAIGATISTEAFSVQKPLMSDISFPVDEIQVARSHRRPTRATAAHTTMFEVLQTAVRSTRGWVRISPIHLLAPRRIQQFQLQDMTEAVDVTHPAVIEKQDWISVLGSCTVDEAGQWIRDMRREPRGRTFLKKGTVLGIVDHKNEVSRVVEIEDVVEEGELDD